MIKFEIEVNIKQLYNALSYFKKFIKRSDYEFEKYLKIRINCDFIELTLLKVDYSITKLIDNFEGSLYFDNLEYTIYLPSLYELINDIYKEDKETVKIVGKDNDIYFNDVGLVNLNDSIEYDYFKPYINDYCKQKITFFDNFDFKIINDKDTNNIFKNVNKLTSVVRDYSNIVKIEKNKYNVYIYLTDLYFLIKKKINVKIYNEFEYKIFINHEILNKIFKNEKQDLLFVNQGKVCMIYNDDVCFVVNIDLNINYPDLQFIYDTFKNINNDNVFYFEFELTKELKNKLNKIKKEYKITDNRHSLEFNLNNNNLNIIALIDDKYDYNYINKNIVNTVIDTNIKDNLKFNVNLKSIINLFNLFNHKIKIKFILNKNSIYNDEKTILKIENNKIKDIDIYLAFNLNE